MSHRERQSAIILPKFETANSFEELEEETY